MGATSMLEYPSPRSTETTANVLYASQAAFRQSSSYRIWWRRTFSSLSELVAKS